MDIQPWLLALLRKTCLTYESTEMQRVSGQRTCRMKSLSGKYTHIGHDQGL